MTEDELSKAVALYYDGKNTPVISAKGYGEIADDIIAIANEHAIPLCDNEQLVNLLITLELGEEIPRELYIAAACILAMAYQLEGKVP